MTNKEIIALFYEEFFNKHHIECALQYVKEDYIQHNPGVAQGRSGLMEAFSQKFKEDQTFHLHVLRIIADDNMAAVYLKNTDTDGRTKCRVVDLYRLEHGMLAEHWDVLQPCT